MSRAVMTIHGYLTDIEDFGILYDSLTGYDCVHKCAVPGHGEGAEIGLFTVDNTIVKVLEDYDMLATQYDSVDVVGFSMGGALASYLCATRPVNRAVLLAPSNRYMSTNAIGKWILYLARQLREPLVESNGSITARLEYTKQYVAKDLADIEVSLGLAANMLSKISIANYTTFSKLMKWCNKTIDTVYNSTGAISTPTLMVMGGLDELVPHKSVEYLASRMCNSRIVDIDNMGHAMLRTHHDDHIVDMIIEHLSAEDSTQEQVA